MSNSDRDVGMPRIGRVSCDAGRYMQNLRDIYSSSIECAVDFPRSGPGPMVRVRSGQVETGQAMDLSCSISIVATLHQGHLPCMICRSWVVRL